MKLVIIESPFAGDTARNLEYLGECIRDSIARGETPFASHALYPQFLDDADPLQRRLGIICGLAWAERADMHIFCTDLGWSPGMLYAWEHSRAKAKEERSIHGNDQRPNRVQS